MAISKDATNATESSADLIANSVITITMNTQTLITQLKTTKSEKDRLKLYADYIDQMPELEEVRLRFSPISPLIESISDKLSDANDQIEDLSEEVYVLENKLLRREQDKENAEAEISRLEDTIEDLKISISNMKEDHAAEVEDLLEQLKK